MDSTHALSRSDLALIEQTARDYYEAWFTGDGDRMANCLHPSLAKRNIDQPDRADSPVDENTWESMVEGAREGRGTRHRGTSFEVKVLDTTRNMASVRIEGGPYLDFLHVGRFGDAWRIVNVLWEPRGRHVP